MTSDIGVPAQTALGLGRLGDSEIESAAVGFAVGATVFFSSTVKIFETLLAGPSVKHQTDMVQLDLAVAQVLPDPVADFHPPAAETRFQIQFHPRARS